MIFHFFLSSTHPSTYLSFHSSDHQIFIEHSLYTRYLYLAKSRSDAYLWVSIIYAIAILCTYGERFVLIIREYLFLSLPTAALFFKLPPSLAISNAEQGSALYTKHISSFVFSFLFLFSLSSFLFSLNFFRITYNFIATSSPFETKQSTNT